MIRITCTHCKTQLTIDDAFAGGVCRCQHCGTIQTVPAHLKGSAERAPTATVASGVAVKSLAPAKGKGGGGSGLDDLVDVVASSGLSSNRLRRPSAGGTAPALLGGRRLPGWVADRPLLVFGGAGGLIVLLLVLVLYLLMSGRGRAGQTGSGPATPAGVNGGSASVTGAPNFCGTPLPGDVVAYVIDNGAASGTLIDSMKGAVFNSLSSLGPQRQFKVVFWNTQAPIYPSGMGPTFAVADNVAAAKQKLADVVAFGATDPTDALRLAAAAKPDMIVLVTAKGADLSPDLVDAFRSIFPAAKPKVIAVAVNPSPGAGVLGTLAAESDGRYVPLPETQLRTFSN